MKIGVDFSRALLREKTGTEEYAYQLVRNIFQTGDSNDEFLLYIKDNSKKTDLNLPPFFSFYRIRGNFLWTQLRLSLELLKRPVDVLLVPSHSVPFIHPKRTVVTIHGLEYKYFPKCYSFLNRIFLELNTFLSVKWSERIIVPSYNTKKDLIKFYKTPSEKINVIYHGFENHKDERGINNLRKKDGSFNIFFVGRIEKRKNIISIVKAFEDFMQKKIDSGHNADSIKLILSGGDGFGASEIKQLVSISPYEKNIVLTGYISSKIKEQFYREADVFIFPSFYEGFGLPILEAMSFGVPVICSNSSSLPEIAGDAALFVDPKNYKSISSAIDVIFCNKDKREQLLAAGYKNLKRFSWRECAIKTLEVLKYKT